MNYILEDVTNSPELWRASDPVRPELDAAFKSSEGRSVVGLKDPDGAWCAFMCYAMTVKVPIDTQTLIEYTDKDGDICVPYTVWSLEKGAGRKIINEVLEMAALSCGKIRRVVTLSPPTSMARRFHIRNEAIELRVNKETVNFEYTV